MLAGMRGEVGWSIISRSAANCDVTLNAGLQYLQSANGCQKGLVQLYAYDSDACTETNPVEDNSCSQCAGAGRATLVFTIISLMIVLVIVFLQVLRLIGRPCCGKKLHSAVILVLLSCASFCYFLTWVMWIGGCHAALQSDDTLHEYTLQPGPAWVLAFLNFILMTVAGGQN